MTNEKGLTFTERLEQEACLERAVEKAESWAVSDESAYRSSSICTVMHLTEVCSRLSANELREAMMAAQAAVRLRRRTARAALRNSAIVAAGSAVFGLVAAGYYPEAKGFACAGLSFIAALIALTLGKQQLGYDDERVREALWVTLLSTLAGRHGDLRAPMKS